MCPPPCGPRRSYRSSCKSSKPAIKTKISKSAVEDVIVSGNYECFYRMGSSTENQPYEGCINNLCLILHDGETKVKVAGRRSKDFIEGYRTIIMDAPCFPAVVILRTEL